MLFSPSPRKRRRLQLQISERRLLLMAGDAFAVVLAVTVALLIWSIVGRRPFTPAFVVPQSFWYVVLLLLWFILASANDFYDLRLAASRLGSIQRLVLINLQLLVVYVLVFFLSEPNALPRLFILYYAVVSFGLMALWRLLNPALVGWASARRHVLVVGTGWGAQTIIEALRGEAGETYRVMGIIGEGDNVGSTIAEVPVIGSGGDLLNYVLRDNISELVLTSSAELGGDTFQGVMDAYERGVTITPMPLLYERITGRVPVQHVGDQWLVVLPIAGRSIFNPYPLLKRFYDVLLGAAGFAVLLLLLLPIAVLIRLDSPGSIFYTQLRVGLNGRYFHIVKFRTMRIGAEAGTGAVFAVRNDPRVTRVGRWLRKTRLDELPQVLNVLRGEMSVVGPRPERPEHITRLQKKIPFYRTRHVVRPGVTGWAQVRYRYGETDDDARIKLQYDLYYIRHQSILLDLNIILRTIGRVLRLSGQ